MYPLLFCANIIVGVITGYGFKKCPRMASVECKPNVIFPKEIFICKRRRDEEISPTKIFNPNLQSNKP